MSTRSTKPDLRARLGTAPATVGVGAAVVLVLALAAWMLLISPARGAIADAREEQSSAEDQVTILTGQLGQLHRQEDGLPVVRREAARLSHVIPRTADQPGFFAGISRCAVRAGIDPDDVTVLSPGIPAPVGAAGSAAGAGTPSALTGQEVAVQSVSLSVQGSYGHLVRFLAGLETMERGLLVGSVSYSPGEKGLTLTLTGTTFVAPPVASPQPGT